MSLWSCPVLKYCLTYRFSTPPAASFNQDKYPHLCGLELTENVECEEIDILIGQDFADALIPLEVRKGFIRNSWPVFCLALVAAPRPVQGRLSSYSCHMPFVDILIVILSHQLKPFHINQIAVMKIGLPWEIRASSKESQGI